uniref:NACHT domain-containing protein n=1 Tax=Salvator merianae TaxID=96440 RepID=A0A8D0E7N2_SALMN
MASCTTEEEIRTFEQRLNQYKSGDLRRLTEYFQPDLIWVIENYVTRVLQELCKNKVITPQQAQDYADVEKHQGSTKAAENLVHDFLRTSEVKATGLWKVLFSLRTSSRHPNLHGLVEEIFYNVCHQEHKNFLRDSTSVLKESSQEAQAGGQAFPIQCRYVDIKMVSDICFRRMNDQEHEALAAAGELNEYRLRRKTQAELERITPSRLFRWCFRSRRTPCIVMVSGVAGVGKSTLVQKFVFDWAMGKHCQKFAFIFFFKFRDLNSVGSTSLKNLIECQYPNLRGKLEAILQVPEKLLFIFDGLDESRSDLELSRNRPLNLCAQPRDVKPVNVIITSLLKQTLLKGCSVLLTSRPSQLVHLKAGIFHRVVTIVGFLSQEREQYFRNFFCDDAVAENALAHVREGQVLYTLCYNPSYCWITCTALQPYFAFGSGQTSRLPRTVTQLFVSYVIHMLTNHTRFLPAKEDLRTMLINLGWMADHGLANNILVFSEEHLERYRLNGSLPLSSFLIENIQSGTSASKITYSFVHLTLQEFFAALVYYLDYSKEKFDKRIKEVEGRQRGKYEMFCRFLCGLSHPMTRVALMENLGEFSKSATKRVIDWISAVGCHPLRKMENHEQRRASMNSFSLLFEAQNTLLVRQVMGDEIRMDFAELHLLPVDCVVIAYILSCCKAIELLNLDSCLIQNEGMQRLGPHLYKIKELRLCDNNLKGQGVVDLASAIQNQECRLETLSLGDNSLSDQCFHDLSCALLHNWTLLSLDISKNKLQEHGISALLEAFSSPRCKLQKLIIQENCLSDRVCTRLCSALSENTSLTHLDLSFNPLTRHCVDELHHFILTSPALKEIRLNATDIPREMEEHLQNLESSREGLRIYF